MSARRYPQSQEVDLVIVGSGAAGGVMAKELAVAGFSVVVLEQGPRVESYEFKHDEYETFWGGSYKNHPSTQPQNFKAGPEGEVQPSVNTWMTPPGRRRISPTRGWRECHVHGQLLALQADRLHGTECPRFD